jgi:hypothetical protein
LIGSITRRTDYQIIKWPTTIQLVGVWLAQDSREEKKYQENEQMGRSEEKITRTEKFKIAGIIGIAVFVVSMIIWSAFETHIRYLVAEFFESLQNVSSSVFNIYSLAYSNDITLSIDIKW